MLLGVAVAVRSLVLWQFGGQLANDPDAYHDIARNLVAGEGYGFTSGQPNGSPTAYRPPLYPCLLALIELAVGGDDRMFRQSLGFLQLVLGAGTVVLTVLIARQLKLDHAGLFVGLVLALDPLSVYNTALVMTETTATFLVALLFWVALRTRGTVDWFVTGTVFGMCCLCRPTFWAFGGIVAAGWAVGLSFRSKSPTPGTESTIAWKPAVAAFLGTALVVAPWVVRNALMMGKPILTTTHGGYTLLLGHNPIYTDRVVNQPWGTVWQIDSDEEWIEWLDAGMRSENPPIDPSQPTSPALELARDRWMSRRARDYMLEAPGTAVRSSLTLVGRFWNIVPMTTSNRSPPTLVRWTIGAFYAGTFGAAMLGLIRLRRDEWRAWWPFLALILSFTAVHALYWADMRMRAPLTPAIVVLAVRGTFWRVRDRSNAPRD